MYQILYRDQDYNLSDEFCSDFLDNNSILNLNGQSAMLCEGILSLKEFYNALQIFSNRKAPGNDGLSDEFYKCFWDLLGQQLTDSLNFSLKNGALSNSQKQAIIKLIDKKDREAIHKELVAYIAFKR